MPRTGCDVTWIYISDLDLHGSLATEFHELRALEKLELADTNVTGNLDVLKDNTALTYLDLKNTRIAGNLQSLPKITKLRGLYLRGTQVYGDVVALSNATDLYGLDLSVTKVYGDLAALRNAMNLLTLRLSEAEVYGDLVSFANLKELRELQLRNTKVYGDVGALSNARGLRHLDLSETKVSGEIAGLTNAKDLDYLDLSETEVYGDMASLANLTDLRTVKLSNTKVSGDFSVILHWKKIIHLGLSGTKVSGHPTEDFKDCCKNLETLELAWTEVRVLDGFLANFESYNLSEEAFNCPFPALTTLDVTRTSLNTTVERLLGPFIKCKALRIFKAAECSLTGEMPACVRVGWIGKSLALCCIDHWPLSKVLQLLDLSSNNVSKVEVLPGNCRAVSFRDNPQISFEEDVVKKATEHFVSLDLRNATFAHPSDTSSSKSLRTVFKAGSSRPLVCGQSS